MIDKDGGFTYNNIVNIHFHSPITFFTNPVKNILNITSTIVQQISITDLKGTLMAKTTIKAGYNSFDVSNYATGVYIINTSDGFTKKFLKN